MRLSQLTGKEVLDLGDGARLGVVEECELTFDEASGKIATLLLPKKNSLLNIFSDSRVIQIPWQAIRRVGDEVIIVDANNAYDRGFNNYKNRRRDNEY